ncbi:hypothetical protein LINPERHAP1_LOCUS36768 [Linum perenne]
MSSSPPFAVTVGSLTAVPSDRPPEMISTINLSFAGVNSGDASATPSLEGTGGMVSATAPPNRSYLGAVRGCESQPPNGNQAWIPVGTNDIILSASNGIKALNLSKEFKEKLCKPWSNSVVVRLMGKSIGDYFLIKFSYEQDYFKALTGGPWTILDHYLVVHQWDQSFRVSNDLPKKMVVWVQFPHLPIHFYHAQILTSLGNLIGKTIKIDFNTQRAERGKFARIAIEVDLGEPIPPVVLLDGAPQLVEYENMPSLCFECGRINHDSKDCPRKVVLDPTPSLDQTYPKDLLSATSDAVPPPEQYGPWMLVSWRQSVQTR